MKCDICEHHIENEVYYEGTITPSNEGAYYEYTMCMKCATSINITLFDILQKVNKLW